VHGSKKAAGRGAFGRPPGSLHRGVSIAGRRGASAYDHPPVHGVELSVWQVPVVPAHRPAGSRPARLPGSDGVSWCPGRFLVDDRTQTSSRTAQQFPAGGSSGRRRVTSATARPGRSWAGTPVRLCRTGLHVRSRQEVSARGGLRGPRHDFGVPWWRSPTGSPVTARRVRVRLLVTTSAFEDVLTPSYHRPSQRTATLPSGRAATLLPVRVSANGEGRPSLNPGTAGARSDEGAAARRVSGCGCLFLRRAELRAVHRRGSAFLLQRTPTRLPGSPRRPARRTTDDGPHRATPPARCAGRRGPPRHPAVAAGPADPARPR
jgi:hypothetical protein